MKKTLKNERGITLIALVVTIIVLLILAGVTINAVFGENGLIKQVEIAKEKNTIASYQDEVDRALLAAKTICIAENRNGDILLEAKKELEQSTLFKDATFSEISNGEFTINTKDSYLVTVTENGATVTKHNGVGDEKLKVQILQKDNKIENTTCVGSNTITVRVVKDSKYADYMNHIKYYLQEKTDIVTRERIAYLYYEILNSKDEEAVLKLLQQLKSENKTLSQYIEAQYNATLEDKLYEEWIELESDFDIGFVPGLVYCLVNIGKEKETTYIINEWNKSNSSNQVTTIDEVVTNMYGSEITVKALAAEYGCTEEVVLDYVFLMTGCFSSMDKEDLNRYEVLEEEYKQLIESTATANIKFPDGTEKEANSASYTVEENGTYEFEVTYNGNTEKHKVVVTRIEHSNMQEETEYHDNQDGTHTAVTRYSCGECGTSYERTITESHTGQGTEGYFDNGDGTHTYHVSYHCDICGADVEEEGTPETHDDGGASGVIEDNGDGTHSWTRNYTCMECGAIIDERGTPEPHGNKSYVPNNDGTHSIRCGDAPENGCGADLGTEACTDADGDGNCDICYGSMSTVE